MGLDLRIRRIVLAAMIVGVILYGSLFPFQLRLHPLPGNPVSYLLSTWHDPLDRIDIIENVAIYIPVGFFIALTMRPSRRAMILASLLGAALSICVELLQFFDRTRDPSVSDVIANTTGSIAGALLGVAAVRWLPGRIFATLLLAVGILNRVVPPLAPAPSLMVAIIRAAIVWLAMAALIEVVFGARARIAIVIIAAGVLVARPTISEAVGFAIALVVWFAALNRVKWRAPAIAGLFAALIVEMALEPFTFQSTPHRIHLMPFAALLYAPTENALRVFTEKTFLYAAFVWLAWRAGLNWLAAALGCAGLVLALRIGQMYLPARVADITDVVILVLTAMGIPLLSEGRSTSLERGRAAR